MCDSQTDSRHDPDPRETQEWLDSLDDVLFRWGPERARALLAQLGARLAARGLGAAGVASTPSSKSRKVALVHNTPNNSTSCGSAADARRARSTSSRYRSDAAVLSCSIRRRTASTT